MSDYEVREGRVEFVAMSGKKAKFKVGGKTVGAWSTNQDGSPGKEFTELNAIATAGGYAHVEVKPYHGNYQGKAYTSYDVTSVVPIDAPAGAPLVSVGSVGGSERTLEIRAQLAYKVATQLVCAGRVPLDQLDAFAASTFLGIEGLAAPNPVRPDGWAVEAPALPEPEQKSDVPF